MFCPKCGIENPENGKFCRKCGTGLSGVSKALSSNGDPEFEDMAGYSDPAGLSNSAHYTRRGRKLSNDPDDLFSTGIRNVVYGCGFLIISMVLFFTGVAGGHSWWWAMLFPAFSFIAGGVGHIAKSKRVEKRISDKREFDRQNQVAGSTEPASLSTGQTDYVSPQSGQYNTGDLVPSSVVENTTQLLKNDPEGETMTLPKNKV